MKLNKLISVLRRPEIIGDVACEIEGIASDSRKVEQGFLFIAVKGTLSDGHAYIAKAVENGATAVVCQQLPEPLPVGITLIRVPDSADALGKIASSWNGNPSEKLTLVGVTGTNGKTTIATLLYEIFRKLGYKTGLLSTICNYIDDRKVPATHTTPDPLELNRLLAEMATAGCEYAFMEVSSHAIDQKRINGLDFNGAIFTNLTHDHLDYHQTFEAYRDVKKAFFDGLPKHAFALTNIDDKNGLFMLQNTLADKRTYSLLALADFKGKILESHWDGTLMIINDKEITTHFVGRFNAYNLLAVYGAAVLMKSNPEEVLLSLSTMRPVSGRFQTITSPEGFTVIVDYAHTPDALTNVLATINELLPQGKRLITVAGCGGNRDKSKRPVMAKEAVRLSTQVIFTSDNPRFEDPQTIIDDMLAGLDQTEKKKTICVVDRLQAIRTACMMADKGDVVLIAGKGHEDYQEINGVKHHFDDWATVKAIFEESQL
ncbi:MAG: UDP-N-acetylmuramoyl-L-alanyl-D-glutamate--2,6-diaminopimelate ligase [Dysgonamonadaceae bacterium]|nr:UDP-N-acetylmuramoyl-L-alanyl-D-glutamate--2,6-diaminopimelate ligase [Dysgonamonadaceae bacterium]